MSRSRVMQDARAIRTNHRIRSASAGCDATNSAWNAFLDLNSLDGNAGRQPEWMREKEKNYLINFQALKERECARFNGRGYYVMKFFTLLFHFKIYVFIPNEPPLESFHRFDGVAVYVRIHTYRPVAYTTKYKTFYSVDFVMVFGCISV